LREGEGGCRVGGYHDGDRCCAGRRAGGHGDEGNAHGCRQGRPRNGRSRRLHRRHRPRGFQDHRRQYTASAGKWEIQTGPAHIVFAAKDSAKGQYQVSTTIEQLEKPKHPEAYGVFLGGSNLSDPAKQKYGYYVVRGDGKYLIKTRDGENTTTVIDWTESPKIPKEDASGKATYKISVHVAPDTVHFIMDGNVVAAVPKSKFPTDGIAGIRVNHNLHVSVTPLTISK
jgi:hypothetical protein